MNSPLRRSFSIWIFRSLTFSGGPLNLSMSTCRR